MVRSVLLTVVAIVFTCFAAQADTIPPAAREIYRVPGPRGNAIVVMQTRMTDPAPLAGWWPQTRLDEVECANCIQIQAVQKGVPPIVIGAYVRLVFLNHDDPETGIEVLASLLEPHRLWLVIREGSMLLVRRFTVNGASADVMGLGAWSSYDTPAPRRMGSASATIRREGESVVVDVVDHQSPTSTTSSRFVCKQESTTFANEYRRVGPPTQPTQPTQMDTDQKQ